MSAALPAHQRPPAFRVLRIPAWTREPDRVLIDDAEAGIQQSWNTWTGEVLDGLARGEAYPQLVDRIQTLWPARPRDWCDATVRRFFYTLHRLKAIELVFESPATFADGRYRTLQELGRGGVGVAWRVLDTHQGRDDLVVKRAWDYFAPLSKTDALVRDEAEVMGRLDHPGIAKAYDGFEENGLFHLVRAFAPGDELSRWRGKGVADPKRRHRLGRDIADIVDHLHERGYLLLDLRPANFFVHPDATNPMLIDVGHCKRMKDGEIDLGKPRAGRAHGSPGFAAPETAKEGRGTPRTDVWGFGRLYYFISTGQLPKHGMTTADLLAKMDALGVSDDDRRIVARCAHDEAAARPASMGEVSALFE